MYKRYKYIVLVNIVTNTICTVQTKTIDIFK